MPQLTFIHAADLHLGAPLKGLDGAAATSFPGGAQRNLLAEAGFEALARLESACLEHGADFLILAGDIYDDKDGILRARFALRDMFLRLKKAGVQVFAAHGNHDPLRTGGQPVAWPDNVTVFSRNVSCVCVRRGDTPLALVQGISHVREQETDNLSLLFKPYTPDATESMFASLPKDIPADIFQIAVLHCAVGGAGDGHRPYAPCSLSDLTGAGFDYWALGHVHQGKILCDDPFVVYPGSFSGLHINETGPCGSYLVRVDGASCSLTRLPLSPVVWEKIRLPLSEETDTLDLLIERILAALDEASKGLDAVLLCRVILEGQTGLDTVLRRPGNVQTLLERVRRELPPGPDGASVWLKDILVATSPLKDFTLLAERDDLVGEIARMACIMQEDRAKAEDMVARAASPLSMHPKVRKALGDGPAASAEVIGEARSLLCSLLEGDGQ